MKQPLKYYSAFIYLETSSGELKQLIVHWIINDEWHRHTWYYTHPRLDDPHRDAVVHLNSNADIGDACERERKAYESHFTSEQGTT